MATGFDRTEQAEPIAPTGILPSRQARQAIHVPVRLRAGSQLLELTSVDFSQGGAKVQLPAGADRSTLATGSVVLLNSLFLTAPKLSTIAWLKGDWLGLRFSMPLTWSELEELRRTSAASASALRPGAATSPS